MPKKFATVDERRAYWRQWYEQNKHREDYKAYDRATKKRIRKERREWFHDLKMTLKCNRCPENDWVTLDFHHSDPNEKRHGSFQHGWVCMVQRENIKRDS
jgi:hypothetical protein